MDFSHYPVMLKECIDYLNINPDGIYVDCTAGGGGHSEEILRHLNKGMLISIDQDDEAIEVCKNKFEKYKEKSKVVKNNFCNLNDILDDLNILQIDGVIMDLGVSSHQLDTPSRGFSYNSDAKLDMRMDPRSPFSAYELVNNYSEQDLKRIIKDYGEEKFASSVAHRIVIERGKKPIETTLELSNIIKSAVPTSKSEAQHPAKRTFQAIRIEVNKELDVIEPAICTAIKRMKSGGRIVVMTFHSLEDRLVKVTFNKYAQGCICPPDFPICVCGHKPEIKIITRKPVIASEKELSENYRSHSAKLRVVEKI